MRGAGQRHLAADIPTPGTPTTSRERSRDRAPAGKAVGKGVASNRGRPAPRDPVTLGTATATAPGPQPATAGEHAATPPPGAAGMDLDGDGDERVDDDDPFPTGARGAPPQRPAVPVAHIWSPEQDADIAAWMATRRALTDALATAAAALRDHASNPPEILADPIKIVGERVRECQATVAEAEDCATLQCVLVSIWNPSTLTVAKGSPSRCAARTRIGLATWPGWLSIAATAARRRGR